MPPAPSPSQAGGIRKLPPWAWALALAGGALIGFFLLKQPAADREEAGEEAVEESPEPGADGGGYIPPLDDWMQSLGLTPPEDYWGEGYYYTGGDEGETFEPYDWGSRDFALSPLVRMSLEGSYARREAPLAPGAVETLQPGFRSSPVYTRTPTPALPLPAPTPGSPSSSAPPRSGGAAGAS